jgi:hypothetical protein
MSGQSKLAAFAEGAPEPKQKAFNCWNCRLKLDIVIQEGRQKVKCKGAGLRDFRDVCSSWSDGKDLAHFPKAPVGFVPRKWQ